MALIDVAFSVLIVLTDQVRIEDDAVLLNDRAERITNRSFCMFTRISSMPQGGPSKGRLQQAENMPSPKFASTTTWVTFHRLALSDISESFF